MPPGFHLLLSAQFASALADNALLIVAIAALVEQGLPGWWAPLLKFAFTISYVVLAPFVGPLADAIPKARLMAWMNGVKILGVLGLLAGVHPVLAYAVVGLGAAAYAPAKYGLVTEMVEQHRLVLANSWIEVSIVCAALLGTVLGGVIVGDWARDTALAQLCRDTLHGLGLVPQSGLVLSMLVLLAVYGLASLLNLGVPDSGVRYPPSGMRPLALTRSFRGANRTLWQDRDGGLSLAVTTLFWGVGATLQFAVLKWAVEVLGLTLAKAAYLQAAVAVGVIVGATLAGRMVRMEAAKRVLPAGVVLGLLMPVVASIDNVQAAIPLLALVGAVGGFLVVPMNALLQHRGYQVLSAGRSIAVQGFNENLSILVMLAAYAALVAIDVPITLLLWGLGLSIAAAIVVVMRHERRQAAAPLEALPGASGAP